MNKNEIQSTTLNTAWIENLALEEINMEESGIIHMNDHLNPQNVLEEASIKFMGQLRDHFEFFTSKFNEYRSNSSIKIFKISGSVNDFMLFRNSLRLIITRNNSDIINISFMANGKDIFAGRESKSLPQLEKKHKIRAHVGPFNKISWLYQGENVDTRALVRHYLSEFIRLSAR